METINFFQENPNNGFLPSRVTTFERNTFYKPSMGLLIFNTTTNSLQVNIGNSDAPDWREILTGTATGIAQNLNAGVASKCFLLSRVSTVSRDTFVNPAKGLIIYNTTNNTIQVNLGTDSAPDWKDFISNTNIDNGSIAITPENPNNGFVLPRLTTAERNAIANPMTGSIFFNTSTRTFQANLGTAGTPIWNDFTVSESDTLPILSSIPIKTSVLGYYNAAHLLRRSCYKVTKTMINEYATKTPIQALEDLFIFNAPTPTRPLNNLGETYYPTAAESTVTDSINTGNGVITSYEIPMI
jgi:hypothetical protein